MTPVKVLALIVASLVAIKLVIIFIRPKSWLPVVKTCYGKPIIVIPIALVAAGVILVYLLAELTIIQIFAVMAFMMALMAVGVASYGREIIELSEKLLQDKGIFRRAWVSIVVWLVLIVWVFYEIFP